MNKRNMLPEGTRDLVLNECEIKRHLEKNIDDLFSNWGYREVITPTLEFYETFNYYPESLKEEEMYKFFDNKGRILVLRPDMTIPIARLVSTKLKGEALPIRIRYISNVFRVHESLGGRRNEYTDCGIELVGINGIDKDLEILVLALESLKKLGLKNFKLEIGNIEFFNSAFNDLNINKENKEKIAKLIEGKNLKNLEDFLKRLDIKEEYRKFFNKLPWMFGDRKVLEEGKKLAFNNELLKSISYLEELYIQLEELGYKENITFDLGMVPKLNYYTGIIFRGYGEDIGDSILAGGRYNKLIKSYGTDLPAIGFSIDVDLVVIKNIDNNEIMEKNRDIYKFFYGNKDVVQAIKKSEELRKQGKVVELFHDEELSEFKIVKYGGR
ncbi:ATP phosphoribosyltransferase regulatory subunit [Clostridium sp. ZBS2]|uniref:ATP phosphoribosyltransferase regulatory subunit n=1 Tax=Clostridium sp. ZBS2 TaxID=2949976 RepID=UPI0020793A54|nr:ATP phosphoribosyltransferase regulatory subunit [Clostridium sp. ZBS2]